MSTYSFENIDNNRETTNIVREFSYGRNRGEWTFFYFGYSFITKEAFGYIRYPQSEDSFVFPHTNHFMANYLHLFVGNDNIYSQF